MEAAGSGGGGWGGVLSMHVHLVFTDGLAVGQYVNPKFYCNDMLGYQDNIK